MENPRQNNFFFDSFTNFLPHKLIIMKICAFAVYAASQAFNFNKD